MYINHKYLTLLSGSDVIVAVNTVNFGIQLNESQDYVRRESAVIFDKYTFEL